jgi:hypothetical protein
VANIKISIIFEDFFRGIEAVSRIFSGIEAFLKSCEAFSAILTFIKPIAF